MISPFVPAGTTSSGPTRRSALAVTTRSLPCRPARPAQPGFARTSGKIEKV